MIKTLIPVLGDQLSLGLSSMAGVTPTDAVILMMEVADEASYVRHHKAKIAYIFSAMRHHADRLRGLGWTVDYVTLDDPANDGSFTAEVARAVERHRPDSIRVTEAGEWRVQAMLDSWADRFAIPVTICPDTRFIASHAEFEAWTAGRKQLRMEYFYRDMRRKTGLLMDGDQPAGGQWNFDSENRKPPPGGGTAIPRPPRFAPDAVTQDVLALVAARFGNHPGSLDHADWAVTAEDAQAAQDWFITHALPLFGDYQDAMLRGEPFLWHSLLSPYINSGLIDPLDLCRAVEAAWAAGHVPINAAEGFIRQIIGWREYMRGIYWHAGPDYRDGNALDATLPLPGYYYDGQTKMACMAAAIGQTLDHGYAHHIQRLMVTGNFALLAGLAPRAVQDWYLEVYLDAYEWVELPNVHGMALFADGGLLASKPYAASGAYIDRMSDYCGKCHYRVKKRMEADACPFNALYWDFVVRNEGKLAKNPRMAPMYRNWARMKEADKDGLLARALWLRANLDSL